MWSKHGSITHTNGAGYHGRRISSKAGPRRALRVARCPDTCVMAECAAWSLDVREESLPPACGTPFPKPHPSLGQRSDLLQLVIVPHRLSHSSRGVLSCLRGSKRFILSDGCFFQSVLPMPSTRSSPRMVDREGSTQSLAFCFSAVIVLVHEVGASEALCNLDSCIKYLKDTSQFTLT